MSQQSIGLDPSLQNYLLEVSLREPAACRALREETLALPEAQMLSSPEQVQLLAMLTAMIGARRYLEVGTFTGYTSLWIMLAGAEDASMLCCDISRDYTDIARRHWAAAGVAEQIELVLAPALETLRARLAAGEAGSYDFVYLDADKENYIGYAEHALQLLRPGGLLAVDNVLWSGSVIDADDDSESTVAIREFNRWARARQDVQLSLIPIGDGLTLMRKL